MKKLFLIFLFSISSFFIFAFDFGGTIKDDFNMKIPVESPISLHNNFYTSVWFKAPFDYYGHTNFEFDCGFGIYSNLTAKTKHMFFDINKLYLTMKIPLSTYFYCNYTMGRNYFSDVSNLVFNDKLDFISFGFNFDSIDFSILGGYTGLQNYYTNNTVKDYIQLTDSKLYGLSSAQNIIFDINLNFSIPYFLNKFSLESLFIQDFHYKSLDLYLTALIENAFSRNLFYDLQSTFQFSSLETGKFANVTKANLTYKVKQSNFSIKALYASNESAFSSEFVPYTSTKIDALGYYSPSSLLSVGTEISFLNPQVNYFSTNIDFFFLYNELKNKYDYDALEWNMTLDIYATSDVFLSVSFGHILNKQLKSNFLLNTTLKIYY